VNDVAQLHEGVTRVNVFASYLERASGRLLDVGCGVGETMRWTPDALAVIGIDVSIEYCRKAAAAGERVLCGDIGRPLPFRAGTFDWAVCSDTFEHLVNPLDLALELRRVLRVGGGLLSHVPNESTPRSLRHVVRGGGISNRGF
jgi:SAM-dependent methyltransferase